MIRKIPNETPTYHFYNANPKGRRTTDCVIRSICTALEQDYNKTVIELAELQCSTGYDDGDKKLYDKYLQSKGWQKHQQPRKWDNTKYTGDEWCGEVQAVIRRDRSTPWRRMVANIGGGHIVAIMDGKIYDTWDSGDGCIGNYWTK